MKRDEIEKLIKYGEESKFIDYKMIDYNLSDDEKKTDFIKDVLSMANTPRDENEPTFIFLGVIHKIGEDNEIVGIDRFRDEMHYQNILSGKHINTPPIIKCHPLIIDGKKVFCIEICIEKNNSSPYTTTKDFCTKIIRDRIYYRVGSSNKEATGIAREQIHRWFAEKKFRPAVGLEGAAWNDLYSRLFLMGKRHDIVLILPASSVGLTAEVAHLGLLSPYVIVDFDSKSEESGSYAYIEPIIKPRRLVHKVKPGDIAQFNHRSTTWYFARGFNDSENSIELSHREWLRINVRTLSFIHEICTRTAPKPLTIIMLAAGKAVERYEEDIIGSLTAFDNVRIYVITDKTTEKDDAFFDEFKNEVSVLPVGIKNFTEAIKCVVKPSAEVTERTLPGIQSMPCAIKSEEQNWINEYLDMCYLENEFSNESGPENFRKGGEPTWADMYRRYDCDRKVTRDLTREIGISLAKRRQNRFNLYHSPGAGGSTVAKRVLWDLHETYPVGELLTCVPAGSVAACLDFITRETSNSLLLLIDSSRFYQDDIEKLYEKIRAEQLPVVMLQTARRYEAPSTPSSPRSKWLPQELLKPEAEQIEEAYINSVPANRDSIKSVFQDKRQWQCICFGLAAYAENYQGISAYTASRLKYLSPAQKDIMVSFALAYFYGQQALSPQFFATFLGKTPADLIDLENIFIDESTGAIDLLVMEDSGNEYRVMHQLIAKEILRQVLSARGQSDGECDKKFNESWKTALSVFARNFAEMLAQSPNSQRGKELLYRIFIDRAGRIDLSQEKQRYSMLFEDIPSEQGRLELFRSLSELFPHEAHIHAHMARINSHVGNFGQAKESIKKALDIDPDDHVIHHIHGTILHREIKDELRERDINWEKIETLSVEALACYAQSRILDGGKEHGYISAIELCILLVDTAKKKFKRTLPELLLDKVRAQFFLTLLGTANELFDTLRESLEGANLGGHIVQCEAKLKAAQDDYSKALECYNNLLSRLDVAKPQLRRLLSRTYESRSRQTTAEFDQDTAERVYHLMEANIKEERNYTKNMPLWLRSARGLKQPPTLEKVIELLSYWKAESNDINAHFYLATMLSLQVIDGISGALRHAEIALEECKNAARYNAWRTYSREWLVNVPGIKGVISHSSVGEWDERIEFFADYSRLREVEGRVSKIIDNGKGVVTLKCGLNAFFIPGRFGITQGKDENKSIKFYLAFSYDGLIAWHLPNKERLASEE